MTADVELPLPGWLATNDGAAGVIGAEGIPIIRRAMKDYARANVAHATAAKDAEIAGWKMAERAEYDLRMEAEAEIEALRAEAIRTEAELHQQAELAEARAERLAEALRPFAALYHPDHLASHGHEQTDSRAVYGINSATITLGDLRLAHALLHPAAAQENDDEQND